MSVFLVDKSIEHKLILNNKNNTNNINEKSEKIIIKVGTNTIINNNELNKKFLTRLIYETNNLLEQEKKVLIVTSGAVGLGKTKINYKKEMTIKSQQGLAAIGQIMLMYEYKKRFDAIGLNCAQILISKKDLLDSKSIINLENTINFLFENQIVPIINENDVVATEELKNSKFSDNDSLAVLLAKEINANLIIMITQKEGLIGKNGKIIKNYYSKKQLKKMENSKDGRGGIKTKIRMIQKANCFCDVFITGPNNFNDFSKGNAIGTFCKTKKID